MGRSYRRTYFFYLSHPYLQVFQELLKVLFSWFWTISKRSKRVNKRVTGTMLSLFLLTQYNFPWWHAIYVCMFICMCACTLFPIGILNETFFCNWSVCFSSLIMTKPRGRLLLNYIYSNTFSGFHICVCFLFLHFHLFYTKT